MAQIGTALGALDQKPTLLAWPPTEAAILEHGPWALKSICVACLATFAYTLRVKEELHTPDILRTKQAVRQARPDSAKEQEEQWRADELARRKPKLDDLIAVASKFVEGDQACRVKFRELFEACIDVRALDPRCPELGRGFHLAASLLVEELVQATKLTRDGTSAMHKTGEDMADLISQYNMLHAMCRGLHMSREQYAQLWAKVRELRWQSWASQLVLWRMRIPDVLKAFKVIFLARKYAPMLLVSSLFKVSGNAMGAVETLYKAEALETLRQPGFTLAGISRKLRAMVYVAAVRLFVTMVADRLNLIAMMRLHHKLRTEVYAAMLRQDLAWFRLGEQNQRDIHGLFKQIFALPELASTFVNAITRTLESFSSIIAVGTLIQQRSSGLVFFFAAGEVMIHAGRTVLNITSEWLKAMVTRTHAKVEVSWVEPLLPENISTVRACAAEPTVLQNWNMFFRTEHATHNLTNLVDHIRAPFDFALRQGFFVAIIGHGAHLIQQNKIPFIADILSLQSLSEQLGTTIFEAVAAVMWIRKALPPLARTYDVIYSQPSIGLEGGIVPAEPRAKGSIEFRDVSFSYPASNEVLTRISFEVPVQHHCGITGSTGAGKSTLLLLIQRLYDVAEGHVLIDGMDIKTLNPMWVRQQIAVVSQRPRIFHMSLLKNLTYGCNPDPSEQEVITACKAACVFDVIFKNPVRFPLGLHTRVSNDTLSGGELQRVAIARALLKDRPILLLDEATSALDSEAQSLVKEGLKNLVKGRTVITVAHRLETIKDATTIICLEEGKLKEQGTHHKLVQAGGLYSRLYREQIESTISDFGGAFSPGSTEAAPEAGIQVSQPLP